MAYRSMCQLELLENYVPVISHVSLCNISTADKVVDHSVIVEPTLKFTPHVVTIIVLPKLVLGLV